MVCSICINIDVVRVLCVCVFECSMVLAVLEISGGNIGMLVPSL